MKPQRISSLFLDIGGVFLTNGWDRHMRESASEKFGFDIDEMNERHSLIFGTYELGKISLDEYLNYAVFYQPRSFDIQEFKEFMFHQSQPFDLMIQLFKDLKNKYHLKVVCVTNEGRELMNHRIHQFHLTEFVDIFVCSAFVHLRKPDPEIYHLAFDLAQVHPSEVIYVDDRPLLVEMGKNFGMHSIVHSNYEKTRKQLEEILSERNNGY